MSSLKTIQTGRAPAAIGPYSQAIVANGVVYCSGQIPLDPATMTIDMLEPPAGAASAEVATRPRVSVMTSVRSDMRQSFSGVVAPAGTAGALVLSPTRAPDSMNA